MAQLDYAVYVAPSKAAVSDDLPPGEARRMWSPTASTLIYGENDAVLVDPLMTIHESRALADWVAATGKNVTTVFVTHAHGDHFFGAPAVLERFPDATLVATPGVAAHMDAQWGPRWFDGFWAPRFPGQISDRHVVAQPLAADGLVELEGERLHAVELGHTDSDGTSALHVPSIGLVVAGDAVYGDVHLYLAESKGNGRKEWLGALDAIESLRPAAVVSGHKRDGDPDSPEDIGRTRRYIEDFTAAAEKAGSHTDLYEAMVALYPDRRNRGVLWNSAKSVMS
ncbi:MBL fold metallo-hydrolase [Microbispora sp. ATCC PTA-5024]|uniref:MBL fold metallo-hydrolase n=1 Tax=Microbispora sp. ATCC PTA-5024 TaxID=316330 RepID=UPI0003DDE7AE|nr:MBL fold metallo-hydrolase [Microbispora sp. ATCC PTA-5024]ETK38059.1 beta-lactamase [Microbispora sp. ATCC PTA-5024]